MCCVSYIKFGIQCFQPFLLVSTVRYIYMLCLCRASMGVGVRGCEGYRPSPFKGQCDIFVPVVSLRSSTRKLVANLKSHIMTLAARHYCWDTYELK